MGEGTRKEGRGRAAARRVVSLASLALAPALALAAKRRSARRPRLLLAALAVIPALHLLVLVPELWRGAEETRDVVAYLMAAERVRAGELLYQAVPPGPHVVGGGAPYLYPPVLAAMTALVPLSGAALVRFALLAGVLAFWVYAACLDRVASRGRNSAWGTLLWGALLTAGVAPLGALWVGQVDVLIWALFGIALAFPAARGFGFAAAAFTKPFAVWPLGLALWRERRPVVVGAVAAIALAAALSASAMGPLRLAQASVQWLTDVYPALAQGQFGYLVADVSASPAANHLLGFLGTGNLSLAFLPLQLAHAAGWEPAGAELPAWARVYLTTAGLAAPIVTLWLTRRRSLPLRYAAVMAAAVLFAPIVRATYLGILYAPVAAWLGENSQAQAQAQAQATQA
jgi:hypothetical protein